MKKRRKNTNTLYVQLNEGTIVNGNNNITNILDNSALEYIQEQVILVKCDNKEYVFFPLSLTILNIELEQSEKYILTKYTGHLEKENIDLMMNHLSSQHPNISDDVKEKIRKQLDHIFEKKTYDARANCTILTDIEQGNLNIFGNQNKDIKTFAKIAKKEFFVFLSATSNKDKKPTLEYKVARLLCKKLKRKNIGVFWWEEDKIRKKGWKISTTINMGLAFSSIFIGLAFDVIHKKSNNTYVYDCLLDDNDADKKINRNQPNFFKSEMEKFKKLKDDLDTSERSYTKTAVGGIIDESDFSSLVPKTRTMHFFTYGQPDSNDYDKKYQVLNGENILKDISCIRNENAKISDKKLVKIIVKEILKRLNIKSLQQEYNKICQEKETVLQKKVSSETEALFEPFDPIKTKSQEKSMTDSFLVGDSRSELKEDSESLPSDFYYKYAVIDENGKNAKNHFIIFPEKKYIRGKIYWDLKLVIRDWTKIPEYSDNNYAPLREYIKVKYLKGDSDQDKFDNLTWYEKSDYQNAGYTYTLEKDIGFKAPETFFGNIFFSNLDGTEQKVYFLYYYFSPKKIAYYTFNGQRVSFINKRHFNKMELTSLKDNLYISINNIDEGIQCLKSNKKEYIELHNLTVRDDKEINARLALKSSSSLKKYYLLLKKDKFEEKKLSKQKYRKCIFCGRWIVTDKKLINDKRYCYQHKRKCQYNYIYDAITGINNDEFTYGQLWNTYQANIDQNPPIAINKIKVPEYNKGVVISLLGASGTGKTTFIARMLNVMKDKDDKKATSKDLDNIKYALEPFFSKVDLDYEIVPDGLTWDESITRHNIENKYTLDAEGTNNSTSSNHVISHIPFLFKLVKKGRRCPNYLSFFDVAGAACYGTEKEKLFINKNSDYIMAFKSDCILLFLDTKIDKESKTLKLDLKSSKWILEKLLEKFYSDKENLQQYSLPSLAIVLCKFDKFVRNFDANSYVRATPPAIVGSNFMKSKRYEYIQMCSKEIESYIGFGDGVNGKEFIKKVNDNFSNYCYFGISSIGRSDSFLSNEARSIYKTNPTNIENILLWIMSNEHIIK